MKPLFSLWTLLCILGVALCLAQQSHATTIKPAAPPGVQEMGKSVSATSVAVFQFAFQTAAHHYAIGVNPIRPEIEPLTWTETYSPQIIQRLAVLRKNERDPAILPPLSDSGDD